MRVATPNDPKLSDRGGTAQAVPGSVAEAQPVTARSGSLQRMVSRLFGFGSVIVLAGGVADGFDFVEQIGVESRPVLAVTEASEDMRGANPSGNIGLGATGVSVPGRIEPSAVKNDVRRESKARIAQERERVEISGLDTRQFGSRKRVLNMTQGGAESVERILSLPEATNEQREKDRSGKGGKNAVGDSRVEPFWHLVVYSLIGVAGALTASVLYWFAIPIISGAKTANDLKLSDCGARRGSCVVRRCEDIRASVKGGSDETRPDKK